MPVLVGRNGQIVFAGYRVYWEELFWQHGEPRSFHWDVEGPDFDTVARLRGEAIRMLEREGAGNFEPLQRRGDRRDLVEDLERGVFMWGGEVGEGGVDLAIELFERVREVIEDDDTSGD